MEIRGPMLLPARRQEIELHTQDGLTLVGELAVPAERTPHATLVTLHPLPTAGGFMDSHIFRKAAARLPALADLAVLRFNTRGTTSPRGTSDGSFDGGDSERWDVAAAMSFVAERGLPRPWIVGWSFGTELALKYAADHDVVASLYEKTMAENFAGLMDMDKAQAATKFQELVQTMSKSIGNSRASQMIEIDPKLAVLDRPGELKRANDRLNFCFSLSPPRSKISLNNHIPE